MTLPVHASAVESALRRSAELFAEIAAQTSDGVGVTRAAYGEGEQRAHDIIAAAAAESCLELVRDPALNGMMTLPGRDRSAPRILIGSHLDSVPRGGNFDGLAGVLASLACAAALKASGAVFRRDVTVIAIRAEENAWFGAQHVGSRALLGRLPAGMLKSARRIDSGLTLEHHMVAAGADLSPIIAGEPTLRPEAVHRFLECHIEQGPTLVDQGIPIGVVTAIRGTMKCADAQAWGEYGHAGVVPRAARRDAVLAVSELAMRLDAFWDEAETAGQDLVVTIGKFCTDPRAHGLTIIPGEVSFTIDARSHSLDVLEQCWALISSASEDIARRRGVTFRFAPLSSDPPIAMDTPMRRAMLAGCAELSIPVMELASGAGHDAGDFAAAGVPTGMIFIRNRNGSHNPAEAMDFADFAMAVKLLVLIVSRLADE